MAIYEKCLDNQGSYPPEMVNMTREILTLRRMLWLNHGHKGMYGDDGEMQCGECLHEYGFWDWKRTDIDDMERKMAEATVRKFAEMKETTKGYLKADYWEGKRIEEMTKEEVAVALKKSRDSLLEGIDELVKVKEKVRKLLSSLPKA